MEKNGNYLVVLDGTPSEAAVREIAGSIEAGSRIQLVAPASPPHGTWTFTDGRSRAEARQRVDDALASLAAVGIEAAGQVGDPRPIDAIRDAVSTESFDAIVVTTPASRLSRLLGTDLGSRAARIFEVPVVTRPNAAATRETPRAYLERCGDERRQPQPAAA